jgi:hypothetical protein
VTNSTIDAQGSVTSNAIPSTTTTSIATTSSNSSVKSSSHGLDTSGKIGIGTGVSIGVLILIVLSIIAYLSLKRNALSKTKTQANLQNKLETLKSQGTVVDQHISEYSSSPSHFVELPSGEMPREMPHELSSDEVLHEMPGYPHNTQI